MTVLVGPNLAATTFRESLVRVLTEQADLAEQTGGGSLTSRTVASTLGRLTEHIQSLDVDTIDLATLAEASGEVGSDGRREFQPGPKTRQFLAHVGHDMQQPPSPELMAELVHWSCVDAFATMRARHSETMRAEVDRIKAEAEESRDAGIYRERSAREKTEHRYLMAHTEAEELKKEVIFLRSRVEALEASKPTVKKVAAKKKTSTKKTSTAAKAASK
jgi:hypothetical protein